MNRFDAGRYGFDWIGDEAPDRDGAWLGEIAGRLDGFKEQIRGFITGTSSKRTAHDRTFDEPEFKHPASRADLLHPIL
ncbi:MAG TPA: hypothetical protein VF590_25430 [Isosphaeraceae bacterium]|jgi:hypothetical protein